MDRGFLYGDSVYETVRTWKRVPFLLDQHLDRLGRSMERVFLPWPVERSHLEEEIARSVAESPFDGDVMLRIVVSRGEGPLGLDVSTCTQPRYLIYVVELLDSMVPAVADPEGGGGGVSVVISGVRRNNPRALDPSIKSGNFLNNILAYHDAREARAYEALLCDADGFLAEGTTTNVFVVREGRILTPRSDGILEGITRAVIFEEARRAGIPIAEEIIEPDALRAADEAFLTSSVRGIVPIASVDGVELGGGRRGPVTKRLQGLYLERLDRESGA